MFLVAVLACRFKDKGCCVPYGQSRSAPCHTFRPQLVVIPLTNYFRLFPLFPVHLSPGCRHLCLFYSLDVVHHTLKETDKMPYKTQSLHRF